MTRQENIFIAKRTLADNIYRAAKLEGLAVTFAQTINVIENIATDVRPSDINDIINLKNGWKYILDNLDLDLDLGLIKNCHAYIGRGMDISLCEIGEFRQSSVGVSGTTWRPRTPNTETLHQELLKINNIENVVDRGIVLYCWIMRNQMFRDGNKRVASLVANFELIKNGAGIISVPEQHIADFRMKLVEYYESNDIHIIKQFLEHKCLYEDMSFLTKEDIELDEKNNHNNDYTWDFDL